MFNLNHSEYTTIVRRLGRMLRFYDSSAIVNLLVDTLCAEYDRKNCYFKLDKNIMQRIAIMCMSEATLDQYEDYAGEVDYAELGKYTPVIMRNILFEQ